MIGSWSSSRKRVRTYEIIKAKRDGTELPAEVIRDLVRGYVAGDVADAQMAAFCMAVFFRGMSDAETGALTDAMLRSGDVLDLSDLPGVKVDKHSTGGVGDKVSIALAPIAAACGVVVPMISGRGLGHTGGTLDKLESIPGLDVRLPVERFRRVLASTGACLIGQTERLAPADRRLYALRDVTATVESIPLIAASIMSKKLAEGVDALVLDVKVGSGAFMKTRADAERLARTLVAIGRGMGKRVTALLTAMHQPLGNAVGNALEVKEAIEVLHGGGPPDLQQVTFELAAEMVVLAGRAPDHRAAHAAVAQVVQDGSAFRRLRDIAAAQDGDVRVLDDPDRLPRAEGTLQVRSDRDGVVHSIDAEAIGLAAMALGAGRARVEDAVDHAVGLILHRKVGDRIGRGEPLCTLHFGGRGVESPEQVARRVLDAYQYGLGEPPPEPLVIARIE
jgi:pyrimidine-nucleoside phosphorylase/thymidine phosphorylase